MEATKLTFFSIGTVAVNKPLDTDIIEATADELMPMIDGEITDNLETVSVSGKDASGGSYQANVQTTSTVRAKWLPMGSNRKTAPDVRRGERVALYRYGDSDHYYWCSLFYDTKLRKRETILFLVSDTINEGEEATPSNSYFLEISTHNKLVHFHTSKSDGEPYTYDFQLNTKDGFWIIQDDIGNKMTFDSKNRRFEVINTDGSHIDMDKKNITITAPDTITLDAGNNVIVRAGKDISSTAGNNINDKASKINTQASVTTNTVPTTNFSGDVNIGKKMSSNGMSVVSTGGGGFIVSGPGQFTGAVQVNKLTSSQPISAPNVSGG